MALYAISDLHLPLGINKPMDIFGKQWENYVERLWENWHSLITEQDVIVLPGDFSWATYLEQAVKDFSFLNELPGRKYILKGNHDYWWTTAKKLEEFLAAYQFDTIAFLQNKAVMYQNIALCGTRGWTFGDEHTAEDQKIYSREIIRMELSLKDAMKFNPEQIYAFVHYPPRNRGGIHTGMTELFEKYPVTKCIYGHLHAASHAKAVKGIVNGIEYILVSGDYLGFTPLKLAD